VTARKLTPLCKWWRCFGNNTSKNESLKWIKKSDSRKHRNLIGRLLWLALQKTIWVLLRLSPDDQGFGHGGIQSQHQSTERSLEKSSVQGTFLGEGGMTPQMAGGLGWRYCDFIFFFGGG